MHVRGFVGSKIRGGNLMEDKDIKAILDYAYVEISKNFRSPAIVNEECMDMLRDEVEYYD